jgi:DNA polymerase-3 subunit chi
MTTIAFHILSAETPQATLLHLCKNIAQAYDAGKRVFAYATDQTLTHAIDEQLWQFEITRFIPHAIMNVDSKWQSSPIHLGWDLPQSGNYDFLFNLTQNTVQNMRSFKNIVEIVPSQEDWLSAARERYRVYRAAGHTLQNQDFRTDVTA